MSQSHFTEKQLTDAPPLTYSIRYVWGLDLWALDLPNGKTKHYFSYAEATQALIEFLTLNP